MKKLLFLLICQCLLLSTSAQQLARGGSLGARVGPAEGGNGVLIQEIIPNSTAEALHLQSGDILIQTGQTTLSDVPSLIHQTTQWKAGQRLSVKVQRNGQLLTLSGNVKGKPLERSTHAEVRYSAVAYDQGYLRSILHLPNSSLESDDKPPVVFFLQGFSCSSIDYYYSDSEPIKRLVDGWVRNGFAVYRVEKPGIGDSEGLPDCIDIGFHYEVDAFAKALEELASLPDINKNQIFLFGHSLGGITAPLIAARTPVKGIINYGSVATTWHEYLIKVLREQEIISGTDYQTVENNVRARIPLLYDYFILKKSPQELEKNPEYARLMETGLPLRDGNLMVGRHYSFMQEINETNIVDAFQGANCYVLALHGEHDLHAVDEEWARTTADMVNAFHPGKGSWKILPDTEHAFASVPSMEEYVSMRQNGTFNGAYMRQHFNPAIISETSNWMKMVLNSKS